RPRAQAVPGGVQPPGPVPGDAAVPPPGGGGPAADAEVVARPRGAGGRRGLPAEEDEPRRAAGAVPGGPPRVLPLGLDLRAPAGPPGQREEPADAKHLPRADRERP